MPDKLTNAEIKKAKELIEKLKKASDNYHQAGGGLPYDIGTTLNASALWLDDLLQKIYRYEEENSNLTSDLTSLQNNLTSLQAENERLTTERDNEHRCYLHICEDLKQAVNRNITAKAEAYKEFATKTTDKVEKAKQKYERLCKEQGEKMEEHMHIHFNGIIKIVKDLLKEVGVE